MRKLLFLFILFTLNILYSQDGLIKGTIYSENEILPFATIQIKENKKGTTSDIDGNYKIENLKPGNYTIIASFVGHISQKKTVSISLGQELTVNFSLGSSLSLDEVVVTGTMKPTYVSASPIKIDVITSKELNTYLPAASSSIIESVQLINGVQEVVACGICYTNNISINGLGGSYTAILMDGTPIYGSLASVYGLNGIPNLIIERVEVIKGPNSTLYGSEAVAGVINIITKKPEKQPILSIDLMTSSHEEASGSLAFAPKIGKSTMYFGVNYNYGSHYQDVNNDGFGDGINMDRLSVFSKINIFRKSDKLFTIAGKYYYEDRRNGVEAFLNNRAYKNLRGSDEIYGESIYTNRVELFGTYALNTNANLKIDYSFSNHLQDSYYGSDHYEASQQIGFTNFIWSFNMGKHDILVGSTLRFDAYDDNTVATEEIVDNGIIVNKPNNQFVPGIFAQDEYSFSDKFTALGGVRLDHHKEHGFIFAPRLNLKYKPSQWTTFRSNIGTGFKVVNLFTEDHAFLSGQREVIIADELKPEESYNVSLNFNHVYTGFGGSGSVDTEAFYTYFTNKIIPDYDTPGKIVYENSNGHAKSLGFGVSLNHNFIFPLSLNIGVNYLNTTETEKLDDGTVEKSDLLYAPKWSGILSANYQLKKHHLTFAYTIQYTGVMALPEVFDLDETGTPLPYARSTSSKPFSLHQLQITKNFKERYTLYAGIENVLNFLQKESPLIGYKDPNYAPGFSPYFDTSYAYAPNHGREFFIGFRWDLARKKNQNHVSQK